MEEGAFDPRRRLVGAVVLVVLAVMVLPALLRRPTSQAAGQEVLVVRSSGHSTTSVLRVAAEPGPSHLAAATAQGLTAQGPVNSRHGPVHAPLGVLPSVAAQTVAVVAKYPGITPQARRIAVSPQSSTARRHWYVQVGAYINAGDALAFAHELKEQGFSAHTRLARVAHRGGIIVVVGPYKKGQAQEALSRVASRDKVRGVLVPAAAGAR